TVVGSSLTFSIASQDTVIGAGSLNANGTISGTFTEYSPFHPPNTGGTFTLTRSGTGLTQVPSLTWTAQASVLSGSGCLTVQPSNGVAGSILPASLNVSVQTAGLAPG